MRASSIRAVRFCLAVTIAVALGGNLPAARASIATYYVSSHDGNDGNNGLSPATPFATIAKVNSLALQPGDRVLFKCGDTWRAEMLRVIRSGAAGAPITYGSYPSADCGDKPVISGAQPVTGWSLYAANIYMADLDDGANAARFPPGSTDGINQLFRNGQRLGIGRWPNIDAADGGYATIEAQPSTTTFRDDQLPAGDWSGSTVHIKGMRWYILNRSVTADSGNTLTVNSALDCWGGCAGWGYWIDSHLNTLDREGEWYYQPGSRRVYLYTAADPGTATIEASPVLLGESEYLGGIILGRHLYEHVRYVVIANLEISKWFDHGITTPVNLEADENAYITIRDNLIRDVDTAGINMMTWVWNAQAHGNGYNGWRGGRYLTITGNTIEVANRWGINSYARDSLIEGNTVRDVAQIANLGRAGMGCDTDDGGGMCTEDGDGLRIKVDQDGTYSGNGMTVQHNRLERIGYNGFDVFGYNNSFYRNTIVLPCTSKGDCGGLRSFGGDSLASTAAHDITVSENIIVDSLGNTDGARTDFDDLFGFGLYVDHSSRAVVSSGNTVISATAAGILYQDSTGTIENNTLFNDSAGTMWAYQVNVTGGTSQIASFTGNLMLGKLSTAGTLSVETGGQLSASDYNGFYHANRAAHIYAQGNKTLAQWQAYSGKDAHSAESVTAALAQAEIYYCDRATPRVFLLLRPYVDLAGNPVGPVLTLQPFTSIILIPAGPPYTGFARLLLPVIR